MVQFGGPGTVEPFPDKKQLMTHFFAHTDPIVKDQSRMAGSANLPSGNTAVSTAGMITGEYTRTGNNHCVVRNGIKSNSAADGCGLN